MDSTARFKPFTGQGDHILKATIQRSEYCIAMKACGLLLTFAACCGCGGLYPADDYIAVRPPDSFRALNGIGAHQRMWESIGAKCLMPTKLSPLLDNMQTLVLVGRTYHPPGIEARQWLEQWLSAGQGRTVVYFGRDFDAEAAYRLQTLSKIGDKDQERARQLWALRAADQFEIRAAEATQDAFCGWFYRESGLPPENVSQFTGPWASDLDASGVWPVSVWLLPPSEPVRKRSRDWLAEQLKKPNTTSRPATPNDPNDLVVRSTWDENEIDSYESLDALWDNNYSAKVLLASDKQSPLVTQLTSNSFYRSQILIVANAAPFQNGGLASPLHREIARKIIQQCLPAKRVAFLAYDELGILISHLKEKDPRIAGMELFTTWPLSFLTMHAVLLGALVCMVLLPILGRPRPLPAAALSDFGHHVEAMGKMLHRSGDRAYACQAIVEYHRSVRGEPGPAWAHEKLPPTH